jgi:hypothetical protein
MEELREKVIGLISLRNNLTEDSPFQTLGVSA